jgi:hypothetical protein
MEARLAARCAIVRRKEELTKKMGHAHALWSGSVQGEEIRLF